MAKDKRKPLTALAITLATTFLAGCVPAFAGVPREWDADVAHPATHQDSAYRGETLELAARLVRGRVPFAELEETALVNLDLNGDGLNYDDYELDSWRAAYVGNHLGATRRVLREDYAYSGYYNELVRTISRSRLPAGRGAVQARVDETETETLRGPAQGVPYCFVADASLPSATEMAELAGHGRREVRWLWRFPSLPAWPSGFPSAPKRTFPSSWWTSGYATRQGSYDLYIIGDYAGSYEFA